MGAFKLLVSYTTRAAAVGRPRGLTEPQLGSVVFLESFIRSIVGPFASGTMYSLHPYEVRV